MKTEKRTDNKIKNANLSKHTLNKKKAARKAAGLIAAFAIFAATIVIVLFSTKNLVKVKGSEEQAEKYYTSITVSYGDTLWDIANEYMNDDYTDAREYVDEIMQINNLADEHITAGNKLIVAAFR